MANPYANRVRLVKIEIGPDMSAPPLRAEWQAGVRTLGVWNASGKQIMQIHVPQELGGAIDVQNGALGIELWLSRDA